MKKQERMGSADRRLVCGRRLGTEIFFFFFSRPCITPDWFFFSAGGARPMAQAVSLPSGALLTLCCVCLCKRYWILSFIVNGLNVTN